MFEVLSALCTVSTLAHVIGLSLYRCFLFACTLQWLILKIDLEPSLTVEETGLCSLFPSMSCKFQKDGVALADTTFERPPKVNR